MPKPHAMEKSTSHSQADPFAGAKGKEDSPASFGMTGESALQNGSRANQAIGVPGFGELREDNEGAGVRGY
jgi:hypothetical protein